MAKSKSKTNFNDTHPECPKGSCFLMNTRSSSEELAYLQDTFMNISFGEVAYDASGRVMDNWVPVFVWIPEGQSSMTQPQLFSLGGKIAKALRENFPNMKG